MPCDSKPFRIGQTLDQRKKQVRDSIAALDAKLKKRLVRPVVGANGAIAFAGWNEERNGITDNCAYRRIMATGSALARAEIARAEMLAGRKVNPQTVALGVHSHDGGDTWSQH